MPIAAWLAKASCAPACRRAWRWSTTSSPRCAYVSPDEALLLGAVAASQRQQHGIAWSALKQLLPAAAARAALPSLISLAVLLRDAELTIAPLDAETCDAPDLRIALAHANATAPVH